VSGLELAALQFHGHKATQFTVEEKQVDEKFLFVNNYAVLIADEAEFVAELQNESL